MNKSIFSLIRLWAADRGIYKGGDSKTQYLKFAEESGELAQAILKKDDIEFMDAVGDCVVVLTNIVELYDKENELGGLTIEGCIQEAYNVISARTGKMENGTFVKDV